MNYRIHTALLLAAAAFAACSEPEAASTAPAAEAARVTLLREGAADVTVHAFRREGDLFLFDRLFRDGWSPEGTLSVSLPNGEYKFLFASGAAGSLALEPDPLTPQTSWEEAVFALHENPDAPGTSLPADELFLQYPAADAESVYTLRGDRQTIRARLERAVCRIDVTVKRGYHDGTQYREVPYDAPQSVLDEIDRIDLTVENTGLRVNAGGSSGTATVTATLAAANYAELDEWGFIRLEGPFVIPPAGGGAIGIDIAVVPAADAGLKPEPLHLTGLAERNKSLDITLWITSGYPTVGVEIRTAPIDRKQEGDSGIWE